MKNIYAKLQDVQNELGAITKEENNPFFKSKYFDINALIKHIKPLLQKHKLVLIQPLTHVNEKPALKTILIDSESGESTEDVIVLTENQDPQKMGSAITYFRRYAIQSLFLLEAEDDDGNKAAGNGKQTTANSTQVAQRAPAGQQIGEWEFKTGVSQKTGKPWWGKKPKVGGDMIWLTEVEYAEQANGGKLQAFDRSVSDSMNVPDDAFGGDLETMYQ